MNHTIFDVLMFNVDTRRKSVIKIHLPYDETVTANASLWTCQGWLFVMLSTVCNCSVSEV